MPPSSVPYLQLCFTPLDSPTTIHCSCMCKMGAKQWGVAAHNLIPTWFQHIRLHHGNMDSSSHALYENMLQNVFVLDPGQPGVFLHSLRDWERETHLFHQNYAVHQLSRLYSFVDMNKLYHLPTDGGPCAEQELGHTWTGRESIPAMHIYTLITHIRVSIWHGLTHVTLTLKLKETN